MQSFDSLFQKKFAEAVDRLRDNLLNGLELNRSASLEDMRFIQGQLHALRSIPGMIEEASQDAQQDNR